MKLEECIKNISTTLELKRIAGAYVVDSRNLGKDEILAALKKTANQYADMSNIKKTHVSLLLSERRNERVLTDIILKDILLNKDNYAKEQKLLDEEIIAFEQSIINISNEVDDKDFSENTKFFKFVLETAWAHNDGISPDEKNLIEKIRTKFNITQKEYRILEAKINRFPKNNNETHTRSEIDSVRKILQQNGLLFSIRDNKGIDFDIIPEEIALGLKTIYGKEMRDYGYKQLIASKYVKNKEYLTDIVNKSGYVMKGNLKLGQIQDIIFERIKPSNLLGGYSPRDGLDREILWQWCSDLELQTSGTKNEIINRIINFYDDIKEIKAVTTDPREALLEVFESLATRDAKFLRKQGMISKDLECEHKFEDATNYLFEKLLRHKPLILTGTEHPDGILSHQNKLIMWDNKSKETPVNLKEHIIQFDRYIKKSEKPVSVFMVIAAEFTDNSIAECVKYSLHNDTSILLIRAEDLKTIAKKWNELHKNDEESFNLGYFKQNGKFNKEYIVL